MSKYNIFRFACLTALWLILCYLLIDTRGINFMVIFTIIVSGVIVFVPLYKKYIRKKE